MTGQERLDFVLQTLRAHADEYRSLGVAHMAVFGSVARGEAGEDSDVDLVIELTTPPRLSLLGLVRMERETANLLGSKVDICTNLKSRLAERVRRDAVPVF